MTYLMLDIETLGTAPGSAIIEIACAAFDPTTGEILAEHHTPVCLLSSIACGLTVDPDTAAWHLARGFTGDLRGQPLTLALAALTLWISSYPTAEIYAWGMDFERPLIEAASRACHLPPPWHYGRGNCARSIWKLAFGPRKAATRKEHGALEDVRIQIQDLTTALKALQHGW